MQGIAFPAYCIVCGRPHNNQHGTIEVTPRGAYWHHLISSIDDISSKRHVISVPGHPKCLRSVRQSFWIRWLFIISIIIPTTIYGAAKDWSRFHILGIDLIIASPFIVWHLANPLPIEYTHMSGKYIFSFTDRYYAERFATLNNSKIEERR